jgi:hypothetical protein
MFTGLASPARPWIQLETPNPDLNKYWPVRVWLTELRDRMLKVFQHSNLYTTLPQQFTCLALYGTQATVMLPDYMSLLRFYPLPIGSFMIAVNAQGIVDTLYRQFTMTVRQLVMEFGIDNVSQTVRSLKNSNTNETYLQVNQAIEVNPNFDMTRRGMSKNKKFCSCYWEYGSSEDKYLRESGFDRFPALVSRWQVTGEDPYGNSPGMDALGDVKQLQLQARRKQQLIDRTVTPPMGAPSSMRKNKASVLPGDVTYFDNVTGHQKFEPLYQIDGRAHPALKEDISETEMRIRKAYYEDLFLMIANIDRSNVTAEEIAKRYEEKLLMLGPVVEQQNDDLFDPLVDSTFRRMLEVNIVPPPPPELQGQPLTVRYISILAQAMGLVGLQPIERTVGFIGNLAKMGKPEALVYLNVGEAIKEHAVAAGTPPKIINSDEVVQAELDKMQKQKVAATLAGSMDPLQKGAKAVKDLAGADAGGNNALTQVMARLQGQPPPTDQGQGEAA